MKPIIIVLTAALYTLSAAGAAVSASGPPPTVVHQHFVPEFPAGTPKNGSCWTSSIATNRPDAYRCMAGNSIADPCFAISMPQFVICDPNPAKDDRGFAIRLTKPLPPAPHASGPFSPWMLELRDGSVCTPETGTRALVGKFVVGYDCTAAKALPHGEYAGLADDLDSKYAVWHARRIVYRSGSSGAALVSSSVVPISAVWR